MGQLLYSIYDLVIKIVKQHIGSRSSVKVIEQKQTSNWKVEWNSVYYFVA